MSAATQTTSLLVVGNEEFLRARVTRTFLDSLHQQHGDLTISHADGETLDQYQVLELLGPSLFGGYPVLVISEANKLSKDTLTQVINTISDPDSAVILDITKSTDAGAKAVTTAAQKAGATVEVITSPKNAGDRRKFAQTELRRVGVRADGDALNALVDGEPDFRGIAIRAEQLADDHKTSGSAPTVTAQDVSGIVTGATVTGFVVADALIARNPTAIANATRAALDAGAAPLFIQAACLSTLRDVGHLMTGNTHKMPPWKAQKLRGHAQRWNTATLARAVHEMGVIGETVRSSVRSENDLLAALLRAVA